MVCMETWHLKNIQKVLNGTITYIFISFRDEKEYGLVVNIQSLVPNSISIRVRLRYKTAHSIGVSMPQQCCSIVSVLRRKCQLPVLICEIVWTRDCLPLVHGWVIYKMVKENTHAKHAAYLLCCASLVCAGLSLHLWLVHGLLV